MFALDHDQMGILLRALVLGVFGGTGLILVFLYSRRGPMVSAGVAFVLR